MKLYSRIEIIGPNGREYTYWGQVRAEDQDEGRTLKVFKVFPEGIKRCSCIWGEYNVAVYAIGCQIVEHNIKAEQLKQRTKKVLDE